MNASINRLKIIFMGIFAVAVVAIWTYELLWVWPAKDCAKAGGEWDGGQRICATPIFIPSLTGRPPGMSREAWSKLQAERLVKGEITADPYNPTPVKAPPKAAAAKTPSAAKPVPAPTPTPTPEKK
jgi:hypothetical protein